MRFTKQDTECTHQARIMVCEWVCISTYVPTYADEFNACVCVGLCVNHSLKVVMFVV